MRIEILNKQKEIIKYCLNRNYENSFVKNFDEFTKDGNLSLPMEISFYDKEILCSLRL